MKKMIKLFCILLLCLFIGCRGTLYFDKSYDPSGNITHKAGFYTGNLLSTTTFDNASVDYNGVKFTLNNFKSKGDVEMMESISKMVIYVIAAYGSMGAYPTTLAIIEAFKSGEVDKVVAKVNAGETVTINDFKSVPISKGINKK